MPVGWFNPSITSVPETALPHLCAGSPNQGGAVALSGNGTTAIVGASGDNGIIGAAWIFADAAAGEAVPAMTPVGLLLAALGLAFAGSLLLRR